MKFLVSTNDFQNQLQWQFKSSWKRKSTSEEQKTHRKYIIMQGKRILLGITGGIAAYKIAFLIRLLKKSGAEVKCIMTPASSDFISPLVVSTLSENPVGIEFWNKEDGSWNNHVEYGLWADLFVIAPLTANTLSKMATGSCDNLLAGNVSFHEVKNNCGSSNGS